MDMNALQMICCILSVNSDSVFPKLTPPIKIYLTADKEMQYVGIFC